MPSIEGPTVVSCKTPSLNLSKTGFVIGNDVQWQRTITDANPGDAPINAWLTVKSSPAAADSSGIHVMVTTTPGGNGSIVGPLATLNMKNQDTVNQLRAGPLYYYDIKVQMSPSTFTYTVEQGWIQFDPEVGDDPFPNNGSISLPPAVPVVLFGTNPPPAGTFQPGTRYWVVPCDPGFPAEWVYGSDNAWHVTSVVSQ